MTKQILILNGSPKKNGGTSRFISKLIGVQLAGSHVEYTSLRQKSAHADIVRRLSDIDALVIASPLYVDGIPSHVIEFLQAAEEFCTHNACRFTVYTVSNNGFIEGSHNKSHLKMYECWCRRTGAVWGGGLGIGGGEMFHCLAVYYPIAFAVLIAVNIVKYTAGAVPALSDWRPLAQNIIIYLFFNCGVFLHRTSCRTHPQTPPRKKPLHPRDGAGVPVRPDGGHLHDSHIAVPRKKHLHAFEKGRVLRGGKMMIA